MSHTDRSVQRRFRSNEPNGSPDSFKTWIKKWNAAVLLGDKQFCFVFIFTLEKFSKTDNIVSKITHYYGIYCIYIYMMNIYTHTHLNKTVCTQSWYLVEAGRLGNASYLIFSQFVPAVGTLCDSVPWRGAVGGGVQ